MLNILSMFLAAISFVSSLPRVNLMYARRTAYAMMAATMKIYWIMIQAVRAVMPPATGGLEEMVDTRRVVKDRNKVTRSDMRPGTT